MQAYNDCEGENMNFWERDQYSSNQSIKNKQSNSVNSNFNHSNVGAQNTDHAAGMNNFNLYEQMARLNNMSEEERLKELTKTASNMKQDGRFNSQDLEKVYQTAGMFMTSEQLSRLRTLIDMLKQ